MNTTTSISDEDAINEERFRHYYSENNPAALIIASDGIDDCFGGNEGLYDFYRIVLASFIEKDEETAKAELLDYLPRLSEKGSGDDISIGMIIDKALLQTLNIKKEKTEPESSESDEE